MYILDTDHLSVLDRGVEVMPTDLQSERLISLVQVLGQTRWCVFNLYLSGDLLFVDARHCDGLLNTHLYLFDLYGELL